MEQELETAAKLIDKGAEFAVAYGFQILGALVFLAIGLKLAAWSGNKVRGLAEARKIDTTLARFTGYFVKLIVVAFVIVISLGNFGISIAPLIALAGATALGATLAIQGPLSNYGGGLSIILSRRFAVGNTITVGNASGVVEEITLAATILLGEDGEKIIVPNKEIVGEVIVNSLERRVVQTRLPVAADESCERAIEVLRNTLLDYPDVGREPEPHVGVHDFTYGGVILGLRFWVPTSRYYQVRYDANRVLLAALQDAGISLLPAGGASVPLEALSGDEPALEA